MASPPAIGAGRAGRAGGRAERDAPPPPAGCRGPRDRAISGACRSGLRTAIAIASGSTPSASRRAILRPISSASPRSPAPSSMRSEPSAATAASRVRTGSARGAAGAGPSPAARDPFVDGGAELVAEDAEELGAGGESLAVLEGDGDGRLAGVGKRADELDLLPRQVVEPVQEDGPLRPRPGRLATRQSSERRAVVVDEPAPVPQHLVGLEQGHELALVLALSASATAAAKRGRRGLRPAGRRAGLERGREAGAPRRSRQPAQRRRCGRGAGQPDPLHAAEAVDGGRGRPIARPRGTGRESSSPSRRGCRRVPRIARARGDRRRRWSARRARARNRARPEAVEHLPARPEPGGPAITFSPIARRLLASIDASGLSIGRGRGRGSTLTVPAPADRPGRKRRIRCLFCRRDPRLSSPRAPLLHRPG